MMNEILTPYEKARLTKWKRNKKIKRVVKCKCGSIHEITVLYLYWNCPKCRRNLIYEQNPNWKNCTVLFDRLLVEEKIEEEILDYCPETRRKNLIYGEPNLNNIRRRKKDY